MLPEKTKLDELIEQIDATAVSPAIQPFADATKELAKAVKELADKDKEEDEDTSDPDSEDEEAKKKAEEEARKKKEEKPEDEETKPEDEGDEMREGILALDVTNQLNDLVKAVRELPAQITGLEAKIANLEADNALLRKAVIAQTASSAELHKAILEDRKTRKIVGDPPLVPDASGERFTPPVVMTANFSHETLRKAMKANVITAPQFDYYNSRRRFTADETENERLNKAVSAL